MDWIDLAQDRDQWRALVSMPCSSVEVHWYFWGMHHFLLQCQRVNQETSKKQVASRERTIHSSEMSVIATELHGITTPKVKLHSHHNGNIKYNMTLTLHNIISTAEVMNYEGYSESSLRLFLTTNVKVRESSYMWGSITLLPALQTIT
jgi:hypothetical protein